MHCRLKIENSAIVMSGEAIPDTSIKDLTPMDFLLKMTAIAGMASTGGLTMAQIPAPESFSGWGVHLVLGAVAVASIYGIYKISERQTASAEKTAEAMLALSHSVDASAQAQRELASELKGSPYLLQRIHQERGGHSPGIQAIFDRERTPIQEREIQKGHHS
jgi:hypothetical protein